jgi:hypothetical protein
MTSPQQHSFVPSPVTIGLVSGPVADKNFTARTSAALNANSTLEPDFALTMKNSLSFE